MLQFIKKLICKEECTFYQKKSKGGSKKIAPSLVHFYNSFVSDNGIKKVKRLRMKDVLAMNIANIIEPSDSIKFRYEKVLNLLEKYRVSTKKPFPHRKKG